MMRSARNQQYRSKIPPARQPLVPYPSPQYLGMELYGFPTRRMPGNRLRRPLTAAKILLGSALQMKVLIWKSS